jgi:hypothetical protein
MTEETEDVAPPSAEPPRSRKLSRFLLALARFALVVLLGAAVAGASFYLLRKFGY